MRSKVVLGATAVAFATSASLALAQTPPPQNQPQQQPATPATPAPSVQPDTGNAGNAASKTQQSDADWRSSKIVGVTVYNTAGENIGEVDDLILGTDGRIVNAVLGVGGFLGMGEKLVAVPFTDLKMSRDDRGSIHLVLNNSRESLQSAPDFHYRGDMKR